MPRQKKPSEDLTLFPDEAVVVAEGKGRIRPRARLLRTIGAELILIGAHSPELKDYLLGSNAARIVRHSPKSVLVLRT